MTRHWVSGIVCRLQLQFNEDQPRSQSKTLHAPMPSAERCSHLRRKQMKNWTHLPPPHGRADSACFSEHDRSVSCPLLNMNSRLPRAADVLILQCVLSAHFYREVVAPSLDGILAKIMPSICSSIHSLTHQSTQQSNNARRLHVLTATFHNRFEALKVKFCLPAELLAKFRHNRWHLTCQP